MSPSRIMSESEWRSAEAAHRARVEPEVAAFQARRGANQPHPVYDFLFVYYGTNRRTLTDWRPPVGALLLGPADEHFGSSFPLRPGAGPTTPPEPGEDRRSTGCAAHGWMLDTSRLTAADRQRLGFVEELLAAAEGRRDFHACFGLHEWAMLYRAPQPRHALPLRLDPEALATFLESQTISCTHFDAFRFFTPAAQPLNTRQPTRQNRTDMEQFGCVHVVMDLYKWCYKLCPWVSSELTADAYFLARQAREIDMRASPYDLTPYGLPPIPIETPAGRAEYVTEQQHLSAQGRTLASRLRAEIGALRSSQP